jgi:putative hydrolase of the HAD superfamily
MIQAVLFDMGGTLDGDGQHWLDRFVALYAAAGLVLPRERIRAAFDAAEQEASSDEAIASAGLHGMVERHVAWQLRHLGIDDLSLGAQLVDAFVAAVRPAVVANVAVLRTLADRGLALGVVSNGCGNVQVLCNEFGYAPYLSAIVDSRRVALFKPDPAIYRHAATVIGAVPAHVLMVGDSLERDVFPAKAVGMNTAWLNASAAAAPHAVDVRLRALAELPAALAAPAWSAA